jgi:hypothetical protein
MLTAYLADGGGDRDSGELSQSVSAELSQSVHNLADGGGDRDSAEPAFAAPPACVCASTCVRDQEGLETRSYRQLVSNCVGRQTDRHVISTHTPHIHSHNTHDRRSRRRS